ncbi:MAG: PH domain-containing protein [Helicobacteraceae bacterium]|nr:PH domain-containing protein [Helicobacteraceae bacterium]
MLISKVESINVNQSVFGRILNYGDVVVCGTGGKLSPLKFISNPLELRRQLIYIQESKGN